MKATFIQMSHIFVMLALAVFVTLLGCVNAYEDPDEAVHRSQAARLRSFRARYKAAYVFNLDKHPHPHGTQILRHYPAGISIKASYLQQYGTGQSSPSRYSSQSLH